VRPVFTPFAMFDQVVAAVKDMPDGSESEKQSKEGAQRNVETLKRELERKMAIMNGA
jgi:hypothetical protein